MQDAIRDWDLEGKIRGWLGEDGELRTQIDSDLPNQQVQCILKCKRDALCAGLHTFFAVFQTLCPYLEPKQFESIVGEWEGARKKAGDQVSFSLPFSVALRGERLALNLLHRASAVATATVEMKQAMPRREIALLDTRKTTPGLRNLEKYAVFVGGGRNHRFDQNDALMIKDNHKNYFGGLKAALEFYRKRVGFYTPIIVEIHSIEEFHLAQELGVRHLMLDNFSASEVQTLISSKAPESTIEISGGMNPQTIAPYCLEGVDAISSSYMTQNPPPVDFSLKYRFEDKS